MPTNQNQSGAPVRFRRGSLRNGYHIQGRQQARKLPTPDAGGSDEK
uniref:Uncharacterized protein n=1 Tax=Xenopus tropicalis TaxID=8364 RepID=A0A6I8Q4G8_XENTR